MRARPLDVGSQRPPRHPARRLVPSVEADVTTPDDVGTLFDERGNQARRLRVVDDHDVPLLVSRGGRARGFGQACARKSHALALPELPSVAGRAVEAVVDSLRHREELGISGDHQPVRLEPDAAHVTEQGREHLRHAAAVRRRIDVHDPCACPAAHAHAAAASVRVWTRSSSDQRHEAAHARSDRGSTFETRYTNRSVFFRSLIGATRDAA